MAGFEFPSMAYNGYLKRVHSFMTPEEIGVAWAEYEVIRDLRLAYAWEQQLATRP